MATQKSLFPRKLSLSLTVRVSGLLMLAAIVPLIITVGVIELISRPTLITQASLEMQADAQTHTKLIDSYISERILEAEGLARLQAIQNFLTGDRGPITKANALAGLSTGHGRGSYYEDWSVFDLRGNLQLYYPTRPQPHGQDSQNQPIYIVPSALQHMQQLSQLIQSTPSQSLVSDIFYDRVTNEAYIDIYSPIHDPISYAPVGILRSTFDLQYIWDIVNQEAGTNGQNSYALILDQHGVCIAYTNPDPDPFSRQNSVNLFKSMAPVPGTFQKMAGQIGLYGLGSQGTISMFDKGQQLADALQNNNNQGSFQAVPPGMQETFQIAKSTTFTLPWTYLVLAPTKNTTQVADDQLRLTVVITLAILVLAILLGLGVGRRITMPILRSVAYLQTSSEALKTLATKERTAAAQQTWVVDSSQVGLQSVQYYTHAASMATHRIHEVGTRLVTHWDEIDSPTTKRIIEQFVADTQYLEKAMHYQDSSNNKLASAIKVTVQVADQLALGANSASDAAEQLEKVVNELQQVVGR